MNITAVNDINEAHRLARQHAESAVQYAIRCGELLAAKKAELPHGDFGAWVQANCEFSYSSARAYMQAAAKQTDSALAFSSLREALEHGKPEPEPQGTPLYDAAKQAAADWREYTGTEEFQNLGPEHLPELAQIAQDYQPEHDAAATRVRAEKMVGAMLRDQSAIPTGPVDIPAIPVDRNKSLIVTKLTGDQEWYTPAEYVDRARCVMGSIDCDPASNPHAQQTVQAGAWYSKEDDGLAQAWRGNVWLNPPYSYPEIAQFIGKLIEELRIGNVKQAVLLTNNSADTAWFHDAASAASAICFTRGRIAFYKADDRLSSPTNGQAFFYFGPDKRRFAEIFSRVGSILECVLPVARRCA